MRALPEWAAGLGLRARNVVRMAIEYDHPLLTMSAKEMASRIPGCGLVTAAAICAARGGVPSPGGLSMLTNADFSEQAGFMAKNAADWAAGALTLRERIMMPMEQYALERFAAYVRRRLESLEARAGLRPIYNHKARKTWHTIIGTATAQCATGPINEGDEVYVYVGTHDDTGKLWIRKVSEFEDGRFEKVEP